MISKKIKRKIRLGVNIDHAATLRQVRGGKTPYPDLGSITKRVIIAGADQITIHLREDRRHIQENDVALVTKVSTVPVNLEMAATDQMVRIAKKYKPQWACFVPEKRAELTTEGGLDVVKNKKRISKQVEKLQSFGIEISMFIAPDLKQVRASFEVGADAVEFHTGHWVALFGIKQKKEWKKLVAAAKLANKLGMNVHAGHGLDYQTLKKIKALPFLEEVNIGHSIICYSLEEGLSQVVRKMKKTIQ
jgi:pyridoxine 5-phosphate synthase